MIRLGSQIRLTRREVERFRKITDIEPVDIRTLDDLSLIHILTLPTSDLV